MIRFRFGLCLTIIAAFASIGSAFAENRVGIQKTESGATIELSVNTTTPKPGDTLVFKADLPDDSGPMKRVFLTEIGGQLNKVAKKPPYKWTLPIGKNASGTRTFRVVGLSGKDKPRVLASKKVTVSVSNNMDKFEDIYFSPGRILYLTPGESKELTVIGKTDEGQKTRLSAKTNSLTFKQQKKQGLEYKTEKTPVIDEITNQGVVEAGKPGKAQILVKAGSLTHTRPVVVEAADPIRVEGKNFLKDSDGDNIPNKFERQTGLDPFDANTDGTSRRDSIEHQKPYDLDDNGTPEAADPDAHAFFIPQPQSDNQAKNPKKPWLNPGVRKIVLQVETSGTVDCCLEREEKYKYLPEPSGWFPYESVGGLFSFDIRNANPGETVTVTFYFESIPEKADALMVRTKSREDPQGRWSGRLEGEIDNPLTFQIKNNGPYDHSPTDALIGFKGGFASKR